jgi:nucleotide-binding universal stress UspA family protein
MFRKILIANDGSTGAQRALEMAIGLAQEAKAELHMISVEELPRFPASIDEVIEEKDAANHRFSGVIKHAQLIAKGTEIRFHVKAGHAVPAIVDFVKEHGIDLLIVGFMGHSALYNHLIGSTTDRLVELAPCAVLVIK